MSSPSFVDMCAKELELCGVREGETVAVLSQLDERLDYADAFMAAVEADGHDLALLARVAQPHSAGDADRVLEVERTAAHAASVGFHPLRVAHAGCAKVTLAERPRRGLRRRRRGGWTSSPP